MKKNKISRKEFIERTSKVVGATVLCPTILAVLQSCDSNPASSSQDGLVSECPFHGAQFDIDGNAVGGPTTSPLQRYNYVYNQEDNTILVEGVLTIDVSDLSVEAAKALSGTETESVDSKGLLIYRKTNSDFNVLSRECTHAKQVVDPFQ
tara:strand:+ start:322 stop:771 length:450 start_codon:yes stop_codon:yes gene_type:complete